MFRKKRCDTCSALASHIKNLEIQVSFLQDLVDTLVTSEDVTPVAQSGNPPPQDLVQDLRDPSEPRLPDKVEIAVARMSAGNHHEDAHLTSFARSLVEAGLSEDEVLDRITEGLDLSDY